VVVYDAKLEDEGLYANSSITPFQADVRNYDVLSDVIRKYKIKEVHHLAAELEVLKSIEDPYADADVNLMGTLSVLKACKENHIKKMVFASSGAVYGNPMYLPMEEDHPKRPIWPYGQSKLAAEWYVSRAGYTSFRYGIVYGPREWYGRVLTLFVKRSLAGKPMIIFGSGNQTRDYVYVGDIVKAHLDAPDSGVYNLATGTETSVKQLAALVGGEVEYQDPPEGKSAKGQPQRPRLPDELVHFSLDPSKAKHEFGWAPSVKLDEGLKEEVEWVKRNPGIWDRRARV
jgi:UDP-glucose 4-epimerase